MTQHGYDTIRKASSRCLDIFAHIMDNENAHPATYETIRGSLEDEYGRFKLWGSNIGVFANVHASLDFRLREIPDIAEMFLRQLATLEERLEQVLNMSLHTISGDETTTYEHDVPQNCPECEQFLTLPFDMRRHLEAAHPIDQSLGDESQGNEINTRNVFGSWSHSELLQSIHESLDWLHRLSNMVRKASFGRQNRRANDFMVRDETGKKSVELTQSLQDGLRHLYQHYITTHAAGVGDRLAERLVQTMIMRHKRILYRRDRRESWNLGEGVYAPVTMDRGAQYMDNLDLSSAPQKTTTPKKVMPLDLQRPTKDTVMSASQNASKVTATTVDVSIIRKAVPQSQVSRATSNSLYVADWVLLPPRPSKAKLRKEFICDYCGLLLQASQASNIRVWGDHVRKDLDPYVCIFDECDTPYEIFSSSREWLAHMRFQHRMRWHCFATTHEPSFFESPGALEDHMRETHAGQFSDEEISFLAENSGHPIKPVIEHCPFCQDMAENTEAHVARHLIQFALRSLPWPNNGSDDHEISHTSHSGHIDGPASSSEAENMDEDEDEMPDMRKTDWDAWEEKIQAGIGVSNKDDDEKQNDSTFICERDDEVGLQDFLAPDYNIADDELLEPFRRRASLADVTNTSSQQPIPNRKATVEQLILEEKEFVRVLQVLAKIYRRTLWDALALDEVLLEQLHSNMDHLAYLHQAFLNDLIATVSIGQSVPASLRAMPQPASIGEVFLNNLKRIDPVHHQYAKIHVSAVPMWKSARKNLKSQDLMKQCDQLSQDEISGEHPHNQFEQLEELVNGKHWREHYQTWLNTLSRQTPNDDPAMAALILASEYHRESVLHLGHMLPSEQSGSKDVVSKTILYYDDTDLLTDIGREDIEFTKLIDEFNNDHLRLEVLSEELEHYYDSVKEFRDCFYRCVVEIEQLMKIRSRPAHELTQSKWVRFSTAYFHSPVDLQEIQVSNIVDAHPPSQNPTRGISEV
ncbi:hypothetical protein KVR01_011706 [Diaporthe batatas]|uniref:uncharacterized protein n=1 Tax=Diaporthe batatas TaxID=748121 RepID=UPI001D04CC0C|nr:uncharacterized protein KVR01_011706 [Diaporthe batatas]KAG8158584.1 hypothetical protein KVR01_011706 [Diaporthe batatas]